MVARGSPNLTRRERDVLAALCRPAGRAETFVEPASIREMAETLGVSDAAIKQHLLNLYDKFDLFEGEDHRRVRLANMVISTGVIAREGAGASRRGAAIDPAGGPDRALSEAREAIDLRNWPRGYDLFSAADKRLALSAADLEALGKSALWTGLHEDSIGARQRAYAIHVKEGNNRRAGAVALALVVNNVIRLQFAPASGWLAKGKRHLEEEPDCVEKGTLAFTQSLLAFATGNPEEGLALAKRAFDHGERFGDADLRGLGLALQGYALVQLGRIEEANGFFDEAMASATDGELGPIATGMVYCRTICACLESLDYRRALEWTNAVDKVASDRCTAGFFGDCRTHRASISVFRGDWAKGESEARIACEESERSDLAHSGMALYDVGVVRLRVGDLEGAEEAFRRALECGTNPQPGVALLQFARGDAAGALLSIAGAVKEAPPGSLRRARLLPALVEIARAVGDMVGARNAADELVELARKFRTIALEASAAAALGMAAEMEGDAAAAVAQFRKACRLWLEVQAPYDVAAARTGLASALSKLGDRTAARMELDAARSSFERLGAEPDTRRAARLLEAIV